MNEPTPTPDELAQAHDLISSVCDGRLAAEQADRLRELLRKYSAVRQLYLRLMHLEAALNLNIASGQTLVPDETELEPTGLGDLMSLPAAHPSRRQSKEMIGRAAVRRLPPYPAAGGFANCPQRHSS